MAHAFTPGLKVAPRIWVRRVRELPIPGEILVERGARVSGADLVARAFLPGELQILRLPEKMGIEPFEIMRALRVGQGDHVSAGQVLCEHAGLFGIFKSRFIAPASGVIEFVAERTAHVGLRQASRPLAVEAYISGEVAEIDPGKAVTVASPAALIQGIFGVGGERRGRLTALAARPDCALTPDLIPDDCRGQVLFGGGNPQAETLRRAAAAGAAGLITGSIDDQALAANQGYDLGIA